MSHTSLRVVARVIALPNKIEELKTVLLALIEPTKLESGCIEYFLLQNQEEPTDFTFVEQWQDNAAMDNHLQTSHIQEAFKQAEGLLAAPPDIRRYNLISD